MSNYGIQQVGVCCHGNNLIMATKIFTSSVLATASINQISVS